MARVFQLLLYVALALPSNALTYGPSSYAPPGVFPTSLYNSYYNNPTATSAQPQPVISDPVLVRICANFCKILNVLMHVHSTRYILLGSPTRTTYPRCVMSRSASLAILIVLAQNDTQDPHPLPPRASDDSLLQTAIGQVKWLFANTAIANNTCTLCIAALQIGKLLSLAAPEQGPAFSVFLCQQFQISSTCNTTYTATTYGSVLTQVLAFANVSGYDGQVRAVTLEPRIRCLTGALWLLLL